MAPLVTRIIPQAFDHFNVAHPAVIYVAPGDVQPGDVVTEPTEKQRAALAEEYPAEYGEQGTAGELTHTELAAVEFVKLEWRAAVAFVESAGDGAPLPQYLAAELNRDGGPRASVVNAFKARGLAVPEAQ